MTNPLGHLAKTQYDYTRGLPTGVKDPNLTITKTEYDILDRPVRVTAGFGLSGAELVVAEMSYPTACNSRIFRYNRTL